MPQAAVTDLVTAAFYAVDRISNAQDKGARCSLVPGVQTENAVKTYQKANNLAADGIVGEQTWSKLLQGDATQTLPDSSTDAGDTLPSVSMPEDYADRMEALYQKWESREPFSYDVQKDPLYQQYRDVYTHQGQLAMMDTMGQAAALTGGYGSTYAQTAGQQTFQNYMQQLSAAVPELYGAAYDRYNAEGDRILQEYTLAKDMADGAYAKQTDNYNKLATLLPLGYSPTDDELTAAGMTRPQANTISGYYKSQNAQSTGSNSGYSYSYDTHGYTSEEIRVLQTAAGITVDGIWGPDTNEAYQWYTSGQNGTRTAAQFKADVMTRREFSRVSHKYNSYEDYIREKLQQWGGYMTLSDIQEVAKHYKLSGWT